jgi:hypothetical protein
MYWMVNLESWVNKMFIAENGLTPIGLPKLFVFNRETNGSFGRPNDPLPGRSIRSSSCGTPGFRWLSWTKYDELEEKNNLDCGEGVKSTERERDIYICTEIKSTLAPVWIREFWPKLCPAFVRISHGAPGKKHSWEEAYCGTQCQYNLQPSWTSVHIIIMSISSNLSIYPFMYPSIYLSDAAPSSRVCPGSHVTATRVARKVFAHPPAWENTHFPGLQYHCVMDY